jgi:Carboxypeptidase regulatory-like domain
MKMLQLYTLSVGAALALGCCTGAKAAQRLANVISGSSESLEKAGFHRAGARGQAVTNAANTFRIAGTAVDADGKPVTGAVVECYQYGGQGAPFGGTDMEVTQRVTTGTNGVFEFQVTGVTTLLFARKPGLAPAWNQYWNVTKDQTDQHLNFTPPTTLTGIVVDETDKPVADAEVWVSYACIVREAEEGRSSYAYMTGKPGREYFTTRTAADGKFVIQGFPTNASADFAVQSPGKVLRQPERNGISPDTMRCQPGQRDVRLVMEAAGSIEGKVVAQDTGQPLAGMRVWPQMTQGGFTGFPLKPVESAADGTFRLTEIGSGSYELHAMFGTNQPPEWVAETASVTVEAGQPTREVQVSATRGGFLEVAVLGKVDHQPIAGAGISAHKQRYQTSASSETNGLALLRLPAGEYKVGVYKDASHTDGTDATVEAGRTNHLDIQLSPAPKIAGIVRDASGAPVPNLRLFIVQNWGNTGGEAKTDAKGHYELPWDPQRFGGSQQAFCLVARDLARNLAASQDIDESTTNLDLRLEPGLVAGGRVENEKGTPLTNGTVRLYFWLGNSGSQLEDKPIRTDAQGHFEVSCLPRGHKYSLDATAKGYGSANRSIQEDAETNRVEVETCVLKVADHKLAGEVVDADDKPAVRANVYMYGQGQPQGSVRTDAKGRFKFDAVCEGAIHLSASAQSSYGNVQAQAGDTNVVIRLGVNQSSSSRQAPKRPSLRGKPLPDLAEVELSGEAAPAGKPVLLCLFDVEQRPSRRFVKQLAEQQEALQQKGLTVLGLQAAVTTADSFKEWKEANPVTFPVGRVAEKGAKTKWATEVESLPWLILTDAQKQVIAEGFALEDLDAKLKSQTK